MDPEIQGQEGTEEPQLSDVELQAMELGWKPEEDFKADPKNEGKRWRTADDFLERKSFFDKIEAQKRKVNELERGVRALAEHNAKIEESAYKRALADLRKEKRAALEEGDLVKADELSERIDEIKEQTKAAPVVETPPANPKFDAWVQQNTWYTEDRKMRAFADGLAQQLVAEGVRNPDEIFAAVEREVRDTFPTKFRNPRKETAPSLDVSGKKPAKQDSFKLESWEEKILNDLLKAGAPISREDYIKQIKESRGVK